MLLKHIDLSGHTAAPPSFFMVSAAEDNPRGLHLDPVGLVSSCKNNMREYMQMSNRELPSLDESILCCLCGHEIDVVEWAIRDYKAESYLEWVWRHVATVLRILDHAATYQTKAFVCSVCYEEAIR